MLATNDGKPLFLSIVAIRKVGAVAKLANLRAASKHGQIGISDCSNLHGTIARAARSAAGKKVGFRGTTNDD